jgi:hypothetical protein
MHTYAHLTSSYATPQLCDGLPQALLAESLGSMEAADKMLSESLSIVAETKQRQQQRQAPPNPVAKAPSSAAVYGPAVRPVVLKANPRLSVQLPPKCVRKGVVKMQVQISVYINKKLAEKLEREKNKSQAVREGLNLYFQQKKRGE